ncbi:MAG: glutaredoxin family protein [Chloroflexi bacterium]|nr:glutaredoxin family protein [Chloroflexota bacterium]
MAVEHVAGKNMGKVMLYALSTCVWCKKTRELLESMGIEYDYEYVDLLQGGEKDRALKEVTHWNPDCNFPTMVVNDQKCIVGFDENKIRETLKS